MRWGNEGRAFALAAALAALTPAYAVAADPPSPGGIEEKQRHAEELAVEATRMLMRALDLLIESLPQYGPPRIEDNGDIVIPRLHKEPPGGGAPKPEKTAKPPAGTPL